MPSDNNLIEQQALWVGVFANLIMAFSGYYFYFLTNSEALLLDGNFSMIATLVSGIAVYISKVKHNRSDSFPFGLYLYESLFVFFKGLILLGIILMALLQNGIEVIHFFMGDEIGQVTYGPILYYAVAMGVLSFGMSMYFNNRFRATKRQSTILQVEAKSLIIDGIMSLLLGASFLMISFIPETSPLAFLHSIGDAILVIILSVAFLKTPLTILKTSFIEIGGGSLQDQEEKEEIISWLKECSNEHLTYEKSFINKSGSSYLAVVYLSSSRTTVEVKKISEIRSQMFDKLIAKYNFTDIEIIIS
ncbi:cation transporter [Reichenbachiella sp.]|uniref:cation transporter n=1 Tax=Reichenbachiella sp. TaxID=2184521 RepID=UPI003B5C22A1